MSFIDDLWPVLQPVIAGQIRTGLAAVAGILVAHGAIGSNDVVSFVQIGSGVTLWALMAIWSLLQKYGAAKFTAAVAKLPKVAADTASVGQAINDAKAAVAANELRS